MAISMEEKSRLVGNTIVGYELSGDHQNLWLIFNNGLKAHFRTEGECCSTTWIESIDMPDALLGTIRNIEDINMPNLGDIPTAKRGSVDSVRYYGLKITTDKGSAVIDYRNDSNGYYGGDLYFVGLE
jgi:hypothetical protein